MSLVLLWNIVLIQKISVIIYSAWPETYIQENEQNDKRIEK